MGKVMPTPEASEIEIRVSPRVGGNTVRPVERNSTTQGSSEPFPSWAPWLVPVFVVANVVLFVITMYVNNCPINSKSCIGARIIGRFSFQPVSENPLLGPSAETLEKIGALDVDKVVKGHQGWRLITCIWLHAGVAHILANMLGLLFIGIRLEQEFGFVRIGLLYVISGLGGSLMSALFIQSRISVGASGAVFGLLGGMLSELLTNWSVYANKLAAVLSLLFLIAINLAVGVLPHVDNFAHIGGFMSGFLLGFVFLIRPQFGWVRQKHLPSGYHSSPVKHKYKTYQYVLWITAVIFLVAGFTLGIVMLFQGFNANDHCSWCHYLTCIPTRRWSCNVSKSYCLLSQEGNQLNLTCDGTTRTRSYVVPNANDDRIAELCKQLCQ